MKKNKMSMISKVISMIFLMVLFLFIAINYSLFGLIPSIIMLAVLALGIVILWKDFENDVHIYYTQLLKEDWNRNSDNIDILEEYQEDYNKFIIDLYKHLKDKDSGGNK